jgi:hypothetical protein
MVRILLITLCLFAFLTSHAQKVENVRATASGDQILITYDLSGTSTDQRFKVRLFSSHNNYSTPVVQVTGDLGDNVAAGKNKQIAWTAKTELTGFKGNLEFEVRAELIPPVPVKQNPVVKEPVTAPVTTPAGYKFTGFASVKRGKTMQIGWSGGAPGETVKLELVKDNVPQQTLMNGKNNGTYSWTVPDNQKTGTFQLKITGPAGSGTSPDFSIKHKVPTVVKVLPVVIIAGVLAASGGGGGNSPVNPIIPTKEKLPAAPNPE